MDQRVIITFNTDDIFRNNYLFKNHREYVQYLFKQKGYEVTKWNWESDENGKWHPNKDGIQFKRTDSDWELRIEVTGIVGKNLRSLNAE
jgi:hypothetical protein